MDVSNYSRIICTQSKFYEQQSTVVYSYKETKINTVYILLISVTLEMYETSIRPRLNPLKNSRLYTKRSGAENIGEEYFFSRCKAII